MSKPFFAVFVCCVAGAALAEPAVPAVASCNRANQGLCFEYRNYDAQGLGFMKDACDKRGGDVWAEGKACPKEKRFARCSRELLGSVTATFFSPPATMAKAKEFCSSLALDVVSE